jgi:hypothetical protein
MSDITISATMTAPELFGPQFAGETWAFWLAFCASLFGEPLTGEQLAIFQRHTGRTHPPDKAVREAWAIVGRRGGKSLVAALIAVYIATLRDHSYLKGETGTIMCLAADRKQVRTILRYALNFMHSVPMLASLIESTTKEQITLTNGIVIEVQTSNYRTVRGYTIVAAVCDELAFWRSEDSTNPDFEVLAALRPGMATVPNPLLLCISSPYARRGALWAAYKNHYGKDDSSVLVWQAATRDANPSVETSIIDAALVEDEASALAEYFAEFRKDVETFIEREQIEGLVIPGRRELGPGRDIRYHAFCDPSGGRQDSFTLAIAHAGTHTEAGRIILDCIRERKPPFDPDSVVKEYAALLKSYGIRTIQSDRYAGIWIEAAFAKYGIRCWQSAKPKSEIYKESLPLLNVSGRVELLDHPALVTQISRLERRTGRTGDIIDHSPHSHDDIANAACGALLLASGSGRKKAGAGLIFKSDDARWTSWEGSSSGRPHASPGILGGPDIFRTRN